MQQRLVYDLLHRCLLLSELFRGLYGYDWLSNGLILLGLLWLMPGYRARATTSILTLLRLRVRLEQVSFSALADDCGFGGLHCDSTARLGLLNVRSSFIFLLSAVRFSILIFLHLREVNHEGLFGLDGR